MTAEEVRAILYEALGSTVGLRISTNNPQLLRQRLYTERRASVEFEPLSIHISPTSPSAEVWIVNKGTDNEE